MFENKVTAEEKRHGLDVTNTIPKRSEKNLNNFTGLWVIPKERPGAQRRQARAARAASPALPPLKCRFACTSGR